MFSVQSANQVESVIADMAQWYAAFGLDVSIDGHLDADAVAALDAALADGFTDAVVMPDAAWVDAHLAELIAALAHADEWGEPYVGVDGAESLRRPDGPYLLLLHSDASSDADLAGLTLSALRKALGDETTLTAGEYLVVQRAMFGHHGDHRFDDYQASPSGWMWLADTAVDDRTAMAYWYDPKARVELSACKQGSKNARKGARRSRIVALA